MTENEISKPAVDAAFKMHYKYGPGLLELPYESMLARELKKRGLEVERQVPIRSICEGELIDEAFKADIIVNRKPLLELKASDKMHPVYKRQLNTYSTITDLKLGLLISFGMAKIKDGIVRMINGQIDEMDDGENRSLD